MSPEQARGQTVDKRTDIWAFGAVLYEMLTGGIAFPGETASDTIAAIEREPEWAALPAEVPASVRTLVRRCLGKDPASAARASVGSDNASLRISRLKTDLRVFLRPSRVASATTSIRSVNGFR
jgi:serine/threonine protein kinase